MTLAEQIIELVLEGASYPDEEYQHFCRLKDKHIAGIDRDRSLSTGDELDDTWKIFAKQAAYNDAKRERVASGPSSIPKTGFINKLRRQALARRLGRLQKWG